MSAESQGGFVAFKTTTTSTTLPPVTNPPLPIKDRLFWFCLSLALLIGLAINLMPVTFKVFQKVFGAGYERQGSTEALYFVGQFVGHLGYLLGGRVTGRIGLQSVVRYGLTSAGLGCLLVSAAFRFPMIQFGCVLIGAGSAWLVIGYGKIIAEHFQAVRQRVFAAVTLSMAIGGTFGPIALGSYISIAWMKWQWPWWIPYTMLGTAFILCMFFVPHVPVRASASPTGQGLESGSWQDLLRSTALWLITIGTLLHGLGQMGAVVWLARLYESRLHVSESQVGVMISANLFGFITGRTLMTLYLGGRLRDRILLGISAGIGSTFYVLTILNSDYRLGLLLMFLAGLGMCGDAIALQSYTAFRFRDNAGKAFAFTQAMGQLGGAIGPYFIGFVGERSGTLEHSVWVVPITICCLSVMAFTWELTERLKSRRLVMAGPA